MNWLQLTTVFSFMCVPIRTCNKNREEVIGGVGRYNRIGIKVDKTLLVKSTSPFLYQVKTILKIEVQG